jgi:hypothetical protein
VDINLPLGRTRFHLGWHAVALRAALLGYLACALFTTRLFAEDLWLLVGLSMCLSNVSRYMHGEAAEEAQAEPAEDVAPTPGLPALGSVQHAS